MAFVLLRASAGHSWAARTSSCQRRRTKRGGVAGLRDACVYAFASLRDIANCGNQVLYQVAFESSGEGR